MNLKLIHYLLCGRRLQVEKNLIILMKKGVEEEEKEVRELHC